jgi:hypothetical protein
METCRQLLSIDERWDRHTVLDRCRKFKRNNGRANAGESYSGVKTPLATGTSGRG